MQRIAVYLLLTIAVVTPVSAADSIRESVVQLHFTTRNPDFYRPWTKARPSEGSASGVVVEGNKILTNAHVVRYASQLFVQLKKGGDKMPAKAISVDPRMDLALVELEDPSHIAHLPYLELSDKLPTVKSTVNAYGYPMGGKDLSVTEGIVSRIEYESYYFGGTGLRIQIDAALNPGNSGGPTVQNGKIVGLVFSRITEGENIGYVIPTQEIERFLEDSSDGKFDGKPLFFQSFSTLENPRLREFLGLPKEQSGLVVGEPYHNSDEYPLKRWDVITHIGPHNIDNEGFVDVEDDLRLSFKYYVPKLADRNQVELTVWREGKSIQVNVPVSPVPSRVMPHLLLKYPRYFIYGPLVFSAASNEIAQTLSSSRKWVKYLSYYENPLIGRLYDQPDFEGEELVIVCTRMFPHRITKGYGDPSFAVVTHLNEEPVKNLRQFALLLKECKDDFIRIRLIGSGESLVFRRSEIEASTEEILADEGIRYQCSPDLRAIWE